MSVAMRLPSRMGTMTLRSMTARDSSSFSMAFRLATRTGSGGGGGCAVVDRIKSERQAKGGIHVPGLKAIPLIYTAALLGAQAGGFDFPDFASFDRLKLVGDAR